MKKSDALVALAKIIVDGGMSLTAFTLAYFLRMEWYEISLFNGLARYSLFPAPNTLFPFDMYWEFVVLFTVTLLLVMAIQGRYRLGADEKLLDEFNHTFWGVSASMTLLLGYFFFTKDYFFSRLIFGLAWALTIIFIWSGRGFIRLLVHQFFRLGWGVQSVLILGSGDLASQVLKGVNKHPHYQAVGILTEKKNTAKTWKTLPIWGNFKNIATVLKRKSVDEVWLATENTTSAITADLVAQAHINHKKFKFFPDELGLDLAALKVSTFDKFPIITLLNSPLYGWWAMVKHALDFGFSCIFLIILSPLIFIIGLAIWCTDIKAPIFYRSERVGADGKTFKCYKFRTMVADAEAKKEKLLQKNERQGGVLFKLSEDPRITKLGHTLRKYSIDELPQLLNIVKGDMSFVGPRPHLVEEVNKYPDHNRQLLLLRPGLTGMAQINGRSSLSFEDEMKHEMFYLKNWSLWLDGVIVLKTMIVVVKGENAS